MSSEYYSRNRSPAAGQGALRHTCVVFLRQCKSPWPLRGRTGTNQQSEFQKLDLCRAPVGRQGCTSVIKGKHPCCGPALCLFTMHCIPLCSAQASRATVVLVPSYQMRKWVIKPLIQVASQPSCHSLCPPLPTTIQSASWFVWVFS